MIDKLDDRTEDTQHTSREQDTPQPQSPLLSDAVHLPPAVIPAWGANTIGLRLSVDPNRVALRAGQEHPCAACTWAQPAAQVLRVQNQATFIGRCARYTREDARGSIYLEALPPCLTWYHELTQPRYASKIILPGSSQALQ